MAEMEEPRFLKDPEIRIRPFVQGDAEAVGTLVRDVFERDMEAQLVHDLRRCKAMVLELVAEDAAGELVGHIAFSRMTGCQVGHPLQISCLAPVSVAKQRQMQGIGAALIQSGLDQLQGLGEDVVTVLGAPEYYTRFGFDSELAKKYQGPYSGKVYMAVAFTREAQLENACQVTYATPFQALG